MRRFFIFILLCSFLCPAQDTSEFITHKNSFKVPFHFIGNLIILETRLNGTPLNMILDTGSRYTLITDLNYVPQIVLDEGRIIKIVGYGKGKEFDAYDSPQNELSVGRAVNSNARIIYIIDSELNLTEKLGIPVHGIIGYDLMKDYVVELNFKVKTATFYKPEFFHKKRIGKTQKYSSLDIDISLFKPVIQAEVFLSTGNPLPIKLMLDTGSWDALWLFENSHNQLKLPPHHYFDFLGFGINGSITGNRSKIAKLEFDEIEINEPTTSFPDSVSLSHLGQPEFNGTIGSEILRRFNVIFDYPNGKIYLKKNKNFQEPYHFNLAGIEINQPFPQLHYFEVARVYENSPAAEAGILPGDFIVNLNGVKARDLSMDYIYTLFRSKENKKITVIVNRDGNSLIKRFRLRSLL